MTTTTRLLAGASLAAGWLALAQPAMSETLFKIVTVKDEIVVGLNAAELAALGGDDAGALAKAIAGKGSMTLWQYAVQRGPDGSLRQAPLRKIGVLAANSLRVEPYKTPYKIVPHE
jgi:hypothetical protein